MLVADGRAFGSGSRRYVAPPRIQPSSRLFPDSLSPGERARAHGTPANARSARSGEVFGRAFREEARLRIRLPTGRPVRGRCARARGFRMSSGAPMPGPACGATPAIARLRGGGSGAPAAAGPAHARFEGTMARTGNAHDKAIAELGTGTRRRLILRTGADEGICGRSRYPVASCSARWNSTCSSALSNVFPNEKAHRSVRQSERYGGPDQGPMAGSGVRTSAVALLRSLTMRLTLRA